MAAESKNAVGLGTITMQIKALEKKNLANVIEIGCLLEQASEQCEHGQYEDWLEANFGWSFSTARRYRDVAEFVKSTKLEDLSKIDISLSALYLAADHGAVSPEARAIIKAAQKGRVTYTMAKEIADDIKAERAAKEAAKQAALHPPIELLPDEIDPPEAPPAPSRPAKPSPPPATSTDDDVDDDDSGEPVTVIDEPTLLLQRLDTALLNRPNLDLSQAVIAVGPMRMREIVNMLKVALDAYGLKKAVKAKADAAEAKAKMH